MPDTLEQKLDLTFYALSDRTRRDILKRVINSELRIVDIASKYKSTLMNVSKHVKILHSAGLVSVLKVGRERWCRLSPEGIFLARDAIRAYEQNWAQQLETQRLGEDSSGSP